jgi:nucleoside-diphosphate-sugar epimerase
VIVVTGATGFIGHAVLDELARRSEVAVAIVRQQPATSSTHQFEPTDLATDFIRAGEILKQCAVTTLIHLALPPRERFQSEPQSAAEATRAIDTNLLRACLNSATLRRVILVSSSAVYGPLLPGEDAFAADRLPAPNSAYGRAKLEQEVRWTQASLPASVTIARVFNVTGPREPASLVAGAIAERLASLPERADLQLQSSESIRDFVDVRDAASAILTLSSLAPCNGSLNICSGRGIRISSLAAMLVRVSGKNVNLLPDGKGGESRSVGRIGPIAEQGGWQPRFSLEESIRALWQTRVRLEKGISV